MAEIEKQLATLTSESTDLETQLQSKQKQYGLLLHSLRDILRTLDAGEDAGGSRGGSREGAKSPTTPDGEEAEGRGEGMDVN
jgi:hypothetical protein